MMKALEWIKSKKTPRSIQMAALAAPFVLAALMGVGGFEWLLSVLVSGGAGIFGCAIFYSVYRVTAYERVHEIAADDEDRGDSYRLVMLMCYGLIMAAAFV